MKFTEEWVLYTENDLFKNMFANGLNCLKVIRNRIQDEDRPGSLTIVITPEMMDWINALAVIRKLK